MLKLTLYIVLIVTLGCNSTDLTLNYKNSETVAYNLIKISVDTITKKNIEINTPNYVLDLSSISGLNRKGADNFIAEKNKLLPVTTDDSTLITENSFEDVHVKKSMLIKIHEIKDMSDGLTQVNISKMISTQKKVTMNLYLKRYADGYKIHSCMSFYINESGQ